MNPVDDLPFDQHELVRLLAQFEGAGPAIIEGADELCDQVDAWLDQAADDDPRVAGFQADLLFSRGMLLTARGNYECAIAQLHDSIELSVLSGSAHRQIFGLCAIAMCYEYSGMQDESSARLFEALTLADELGDDRIRAAVLHGLSSIYEAQGAYEQMLESTMRTLAVAEVLQDRLLLLRTYSAIGLTYAHLHRPEEGMPWLHKGLAMIDDDTQPFIKTFLKMNLMYLQRRSGNLEEAVALAEEYEDRLAGLPAQHAAVLYVDIAEIYLEVGDLERAAEMLQHADRVSDPDWMKAHLLSYYLALAELQEARGEPAQALETLRQHMELERELRGRQARTRLVAIERHFAAELAAKTDEVHHLRTVELVDKNAQLSDLIRRNEEILEVVVNDLRNPLAATKLLTQVLLADLSDSKAIEMVQSINSATVEMSHAVTRLLVSQGTDSTVTNTKITLDLDEDAKDTAFGTASKDPASNDALSGHSQTPLD